MSYAKGMEKCEKSYTKMDILLNRRVHKGVQNCPKSSIIIDECCFDYILSENIIRLKDVGKTVLTVQYF